jgi:hypothetical protein
MMADELCSCADAPLRSDNTRAGARLAVYSDEEGGLSSSRDDCRCVDVPDHLRSTAAVLGSSTLCARTQARVTVSACALLRMPSCGAV